jgi:internalin A
MTGFPLPDLQRQLGSLERQLDEMTKGIEQVEGIAASMASQIRIVMSAVNAEVTDCPRLFTVKHANDRMRPLRFWRSRFHLTLWCEHPGAWHPWEPAGYTISEPQEWFRKLDPYLRLIVKTLQFAVPVAVAGVGAALSKVDYEGIQRQLDLMKVVTDKLPKANTSEADLAPGKDGGLTPLEGAALRAFRAFMRKHDPAEYFGGLRWVKDSAGDSLWVCEGHYRTYDPGLPKLPISV